MLTGDVPLVIGSEFRPLKEIREENSIVTASGWGEFCQTKVEDVFVQFDHKGPVLTVTTQRGATLKCSPDQTCFGRLNSLSRGYFLYLMERSSLGFRVGLSCDLMRDLFAMQNLRLDLFNQNEVVDRIWIVETTDSLPRASFLEKFAVFKYGLPNIPFSAKAAESDLSDEMIHELFNRIDTPSRAHQMLLDWLMFEEHPHITVRLSKAKPSASNAIQFIIFGGPEKSRTQNGFVHLIRIDNDIDSTKAEHRQFKRRMSTKGVWHLEVTRDDFEEAQLFVKTLSCLDNLEVVRKIQLTKKAPFYLLPASHLKVGMTVPVLGKRWIEEDSITSIKTEEHQGPLYDIKVNGFNNYVAGQWVIMSYHPTDSPIAKSIKNAGGKQPERALQKDSQK